MIGRSRDGPNRSQAQPARNEVVTVAAAILGDLDSLKAELGSIPGVTGIAPVDSNGDLFRARITCRTSEDLRADIYRKIKATDWILMELSRETRSLENIFRELTKEN